MKFSELIDMFFQQGVDDIEFKKENSKMIIGYFHENPVDLLIVENGHITDIPNLSRWENTEWIFKLKDDDVFIENDCFGCFSCRHGLDIDKETEFECELDGEIKNGEYCCDSFSHPV